MAIELAVWHEGMPVHPDDYEDERLRGRPSEGRWVIMTDHPETDEPLFLLANPQTGQFYWQPVATCIIFRMHTPDVPVPVIPMQLGSPNQQNGLVIPEMNRQMRRNGHN